MRDDERLREVDFRNVIRKYAISRKLTNMLVAGCLRLQARVKTWTAAAEPKVMLSVKPR